MTTYRRTAKGQLIALGTTPRKPKRHGFWSPVVKILRKARKSVS